MSFARLLNDLAAERDRRASFRHLVAMSDRIKFGGRPFHKAMRSMIGELEVMAKSMTENLAQARASHRRMPANAIGAPASAT